MSKLRNIVRGAKPRAVDNPDDETNLENDAPEEELEVDENQPNDSDEDQPEESAEDPVEENEPAASDEVEEDEYTADDEESDEEVQASNRGANRVLSIMGSDLGLANPKAALKLAQKPKLSANDALDILADVKAETPKKGGLSSRMNGKAKALAPEKPSKSASDGQSNDNRILAAANAMIAEKKK
ncbi:MAG: hypothetical protein ABJO86_00695 [Lentilitoribacter sp.]